METSNCEREAPASQDEWVCCPGSSGICLLVPAPNPSCQPLNRPLETHTDLPLSQSDSGAVRSRVVKRVAHLAGGRLYGMTAMHAVILGIILSVCAVIGDLIESIFKREAGVKDSGNFFPGIGGILDLLDSLLFNAPIMYLYVRHILTHD